jgi:hypothetical protein
MAADKLASQEFLPGTTAAAKRSPKSSQKIQVMQGCIVFKENLQAIAEQIRAGGFSR